MDTGALIALNDRSDKNHTAAASYFRHSAREGARFVLGRPVVVEYLDGVTKRVGKSDALVRLRQIDSSALWRGGARPDGDHARAPGGFVKYDAHTTTMS